MKRLLVLVSLVGIAAIVAKLIKLVVFTEEERPVIRVRNGGSLSVSTVDGDFTDLGGEWRHDHPAKGPRRLLVRTVGTDCGSSSFSTNRVEIHCSSSSGTLDPLIIQRRSAGGVSDVFVRPPHAAPTSKPSNTQVLVWPDDSSIVIDRIVIVGQTTCRVVNAAIAEVIIEQKH